MRSKVFGIGLHKTGTSSLQAALAILDYRVAGRRLAGRHRKPLVKLVRAGRVNEVIEWTLRDEAFADFPYPLIFRDLYQHYGRNAKFILTTRRSAEVWYESVCEHSRTSRLFGGQRLTYGFYRPFGRKAQYVAFYEKHNEIVRQYFEANGATDLLLEVCWDAGDGWDKLCAFLGAPIPECPFPHRNKSARGRRRGRRAINFIVEAVYASIVARANAGTTP
jgi:hypothetical protein